MALVWRCLLAANGGLQGYEEVDESQLTPSCVHFPFKPDLEPGKYIWNGESFMPVRKQHPFIPDGPDPWDAVVASLGRVQQNINTAQQMLTILKQLPALESVPAFQALAFGDLPPSVVQFLQYYRNNILRPPVVVNSGGT